MKRKRDLMAEDYAKKYGMFYLKGDAESYDTRMLYEITDYIIETYKDAFIEAHYIIQAEHRAEKHWFDSCRESNGNLLKENESLESQIAKAIDALDRITHQAMSMHMSYESLAVTCKQIASECLAEIESMKGQS